MRERRDKRDVLAEVAQHQGEVVRVPTLQLAGYKVNIAISFHHSTSTPLVLLPRRRQKLSLTGPPSSFL